MTGKRSLAENRKFLEIFRRVTDDSRQDSAAVFFYIDTAFYQRQFAKDQFPNIEGDIEDIEPILRETEFGEILAYGGLVQLPNDEREFDVKVYVSVSLPKGGMVDGLRLTPLQSPVGIQVSRDVDFYTRCNIDLLMFRNLRLLRGAWHGPLPVNDLLLVQIFDFVQHNALATFMSDESINDCTGELDFFGNFVEYEYLQAQRKTIRVFLKDNGSLIDEYLSVIPDENKLISKKLGNHEYFTSPEHVNNQRRKFAIRMAEMMGVEETGMINAMQREGIYSEIRESTARYFASFGDLEHLKFALKTDVDTNILLDSDPDLQLLWRYMQKGNLPNPGMFGFARADGMFRHLFYRLSARSYAILSGKASVANSEKMRQSNPDLNPLSIDSKDLPLVDYLSESAGKWSREKFKKHFRSGAFGVYQTEKGFLVRIIQLRNE